MAYALMGFGVAMHHAYEHMYSVIKTDLPLPMNAVISCTHMASVSCTCVCLLAMK